MRWSLCLFWIISLFFSTKAFAQHGPFCGKCMRSCLKGTTALSKRLRHTGLGRAGKRVVRTYMRRAAKRNLLASLLSFRSPGGLACKALGVATGGVTLALCGAVVGHVTSSIRDREDLKKRRKQLCVSSCLRLKFCSSKRGGSTKPLTDELIAQRTVEALYQAWQELNFRAYFALWDTSAKRYNHWNNTRWDYNKIISRRVKAFQLYSKVETRYTCTTRMQGRDQAKVSCLYDWVGVYKSSGKTDSEYLSKEYYILRRKNGTWLIDENHDYSNYKGGMFRWRVAKSARFRARCEKALRQGASSYLESYSSSVRGAVDRGVVNLVNGEYWAFVRMDVVQKQTDGSILRRNDSISAYLRSADCKRWEGVNAGTAGLEESLPAQVRGKL